MTTPTAQRTSTLPTEPWGRASTHLILGGSADSEEYVGRVPVFSNTSDSERADPRAPFPPQSREPLRAAIGPAIATPLVANLEVARTHCGQESDCPGHIPWQIQPAYPTSTLASNSKLILHFLPPVVTPVTSPPAPSSPSFYTHEPLSPQLMTIEIAGGYLRSVAMNIQNPSTYSLITSSPLPLFAIPLIRLPSPQLRVYMKKHPSLSLRQPW